MQKLSTQPYKGTSDWLPQDYLVQKYIFNVWREVCLRFGYKEYLTPLMELADIYRAKSGVLKEELFTLRDRADRELALRAEMTPSVTRMVAGIYKGSAKPLRLFSIANFFRNEAPQKGRTREFWQLNADIFGESSINADIEILSLGIEIMKAFKAPAGSFKLFFNSRNLIDEFFKYELNISENITAVSRIMDKYGKVDNNDFVAMLKEAGLSDESINKITLFMQSNGEKFASNFPALVEKDGFKQISTIQAALIKLGYKEFFEFKPSIIRGLDYYDGMVFEVYDLNPNNRRSLFGGGRYNGLSEIFGVENFPAVGFAPGNVTLTYFLENWNLLPAFDDSNYYYIPLLSGVNIQDTLAIANVLRAKGLYVETDLTPRSLTDALRLANKKGMEKVLIIGENELKNRELTIKNLRTGTQDTKALEIFISDIL